MTRRVSEMAAESYSLAEVAELLGVSKRTLQRQIRDGAFPGRFLAPSAHGMEMRIPAIDVARAGGSTDGVHFRAASENEWSEGQLATLSTLPSGDGYSGTSDLQVLREGLVAVLREERALFLAEVRAAVEKRDELRQSEIAEMRVAVEKMTDELSQIRAALEGGRGAGEPRQGWAEALGGTPSELDVDGLLSELGELEAMLGVADS